MAGSNPAPSPIPYKTPLKTVFKSSKVKELSPKEVPINTFSRALPMSYPKV